MTDPHTGSQSPEQASDQRVPSTTRRTFVRAAGAGAAGASLGLGVTGGVSAQEGGIPTPWLERDGNLLRDPDGNEVVLRGVNVADPARLDRTDQRYHVTAPGVVRRALNESNGWYNRIVRIPCQTGDIAGDAKNEVDPGSFSQSDLVAYVEDHLRPAVDACAEEGAYAIVDYHRHDDSQLLYTNDELDAEVQMFWETVAPEFAEDSHVLFEVYNEPIAPYPGHNQYGQGAGVDVTDPEAEDTWLTWRDAAQGWVDTIRSAAPRNVVIVGSPRWTQWTYWADEHEFDGENLAYAGHVYAHENLRPLSEYFGKPAENVPVFMTEFGYDDEGQDFLKGTTSEEGEEFRAFFEEYDSVHWQVWCFDPRWQPAMFSEDQGEWTVLGGEDYHGQFFKDYLAEKRDDDLPGGGGTESLPAPSALSAETTATSIELSWAAVSAAEAYAVYREDDDAVVTTEATSALLEDLAAGTAYTVGVTATSGDEESARATLQVQTPVGEGCPGEMDSATVDGQVVCDVDDDGYYRDVNGDGAVGQGDVAAFFTRQHRGAWKQPELFDFSGNDAVTHGDVVELFDYVALQ